MAREAELLGQRSRYVVGLQEALLNEHLPESSSLPALDGQCQGQHLGGDRAIAQENLAEAWKRPAVHGCASWSAGGVCLRVG